MSIVTNRPTTAHQRSLLRSKTALAPVSVGDHMASKIARDCDRHAEIMANSPPLSVPNRPARPQARRALSPSPARPWGEGVLTYPANLSKPARHDDRDDDGSFSPNARNPKPSDSVPSADQREWAATSAAKEARDQAREIVSDWREQEARDEVIASFTGSRYEVSVNLSGFVSEW